MRSLLPKKLGLWRSCACALFALVISLPITSTILKKPPRTFKDAEWVILLVSLPISFIFAYRENLTRGLLAGITTTATLAVTLHLGGAITSSHASAFLLVLCSNLAGLFTRQVVRFTGLCVITAMAFGTGTYQLAVIVLAVGLLAIIEANLFEQAIPRFLQPLIASKPYSFHLLAFGLAFLIVAFAFALMFNTVHLSSPGGAFDLPQEELQNASLANFLYISLFLMATEGPPYAPITTLAKFLVATELVISILLLVVYFSLLAAQLFIAGKEDS